MFRLQHDEVALRKVCSTNCDSSIEIVLQRQNDSLRPVSTGDVSSSISTTYWRLITSSVLVVRIGCSTGMGVTGMAGTALWCTNQQNTTLPQLSTAWSPFHSSPQLSTAYPSARCTGMFTGSRTISESSPRRYMLNMTRIRHSLLSN